MINVDTIDFYDKHVLRLYGHALMRKTSETCVVWEKDDDRLSKQVASLQKKDDKFLFRMDGRFYENLHDI